MQPKLNKYWLPSIEACVKIKPKCAKTFKIRMKIDTKSKYCKNSKNLLACIGLFKTHNGGLRDSLTFLC